MRVGSNPNNHSLMFLKKTSHRVIMPVFIPNEIGYFKDSFNVFQVSLNSLIKTINKDTAITVVLNECFQEVIDFVFELYHKGLIDKVVVNKDNVGKINALITETRASFESYITYADSDVFFDCNWLLQTFKVFKNFPKAGYVSTSPMPDSYTFASATLIDNFLIGKLKIDQCSNCMEYEDLLHFHTSINRDRNLTKKLFNKKVAYVENEIKCFVGAGHFCCTIKKDNILRLSPKTQAITSGSEGDYLDIPFAKSGLWMLSSTKSYIWHMGNVLDQNCSVTNLEKLKNFVESDFVFSNCTQNQGLLFSTLIPFKIRAKFGLLIKYIKKIK